VPPKFKGTLDLVTKEVVKLAMMRHSLKKIVVVGIQQSNLLLGEELIGEAKEYIFENESSIKELEKKVKVSYLERKRQNGFYVDVDHENGSTRNTPASLNMKDALQMIKQVHVYVGLCTALCHIFRDLKKRPGLSSVRIRRVEVPSLQEAEQASPCESDQTITIVFDEI